MNPTIAAALAAAAALSAPTAAQEARPGPEPIVPEGMEEGYEQWRYAPATRVGDMVHFSGVVAGRPEGEDPTQADFEASFERAFERLAHILDSIDADFSDVAEMTSFHVDLGDEDHRNAFLAVKNRYFDAPPYPAWTAIGADRLWLDEAVLEIRLTVYAPEDSE